MPGTLLIVVFYHYIYMTWLDVSYKYIKKSITNHRELHPKKKTERESKWPRVMQSTGKVEFMMSLTRQFCKSEGKGKKQHTQKEVHCKKLL